MKGAQLVLWWADRYTRGLPESERDARRDEIASDVWEHGSALGDGPRSRLLLTSRWLRGVPADLSWRRAQRHGHKRLPTRASVMRGLGWALGGLGYVILLTAHGWNATALVGLDLYGQDWEQGDVATGARISGTLLTALVAGGLLLHRLPLAGAMLIAIGSFMTLVVYWWMIPVTGPCGIAVTIAAVILASRRHASQVRAISATS